MVEIELELQKLQESIRIHRRMLEILYIRLFYITNKRFKTEYEENENEMTIVKSNYQIDILNTKLSYLLTDFDRSFEFYKNIKNGEQQQ